MRFALLAVLPELPRSQESGIDLTRYVLVCMLTIGLVLASAWLLRRFVAQGLRKRASMRSLAVMDVLPLGRRQKAVVLRCYDRSFLVGLGEREVTLLAELDPETQEEFEPSPPAHNARVEEPLVAERPVVEATRVAPITPQPAVRPAREPETAPATADNFAEALAAEIPVDRAPLQPGKRIPKGGLLG